MEELQTVIVGAGVVGLATGLELLKQGQKNVVVVESNYSFGMETSSRNSEVVHAGIYYQPGSLKADMCVLGRRLLYDYCERNHVPFKKCGKLIVATDEQHIERLSQIKKNAAECGVKLGFLSQKQALEKEPNLKCLEALFSAETGIVDSHEFMSSLALNFENMGGIISYETEFIGATRKSEKFVLRFRCRNEEFRVSSQNLINAAGLHSSKISGLIEGLEEDAPVEASFFKGDYYTIPNTNLFNSHIYPLPNLDGTGLGIHATIGLDGSVKFGPSSYKVPAIDYNGSNAERDQFLAAVERYFPEIHHFNLNYSYSGIRPKIKVNDRLYSDFHVKKFEGEFERFICLHGIESPGLTSSLALARHVASLID